MKRLAMNIEGAVQGVGFRPSVYRLALSMGLRGFVMNTASGVEIEVEGEGVEGFAKRLVECAPPLANILRIEVKEREPFGYEGFRIQESGGDRAFTHVSPDAATCPDCLRELFDPSDRRYRYPFINCTNCGPRYSITLGVPYDRARTTMAPFALCPECAREYADPGDRRFHAEPNACALCGPRLFGKGELYEGASDALTRTVELLNSGLIVAIKGLGGFHLACDAARPEAVRRLRALKRRGNKPFALMARDLAMAARHCLIDGAEAALLESRERPIVVLGKRLDCGLPEALAPGMDTLGFMLPYTPLHHLIFGLGGKDEPGCVRGPLVMTSGNLAEEPIVVQNDEAVERLSAMADALLLHDRDIFMRVDDPVIKVSAGGARFIRRARGYAPSPVAFQDDGPDVLAVGADVKCAFTLVRGRHAIVSQHIGDMENHETQRFFEETLANLSSVYKAAPLALAHDLHPGYASTRWALGRGLPCLGVQHHHAHAASVMAEHGLTGRVLALAMDGTGYGPDGSLWGGEFLAADPLGFERLCHLEYMPLPGGESAVREPWRTAAALMDRAFGPEAHGVLERLGFIERHGKERVHGVLRIAGLGEFSPLSSGLGRLCDAVSAILGVRDENTFEGEAAMALEAAARGSSDDAPFPYRIAEGPCPLRLDLLPAVADIAVAAVSGVPREGLARRFHATLISAISETALLLARREGLSAAVLSGGAFQNGILLEGVTRRLEAGGLEVHANRTVPLGDGGISLGQAYILRAALRAGAVPETMRNIAARG